MSLLTKGGGITKLSELVIDADKAWAGMGISNIKELAAAMAHGDINYRGAAVLEKLTAGIAGQYAKTQGAGFALIWDDMPGGMFARLFFLTIPQPPLLSMVAVEDHSGGGHVAEPGLTAPVPTVDKAAEVSSLLIEDCEDAWTEYVQANVTSTADGVTFKFGTASAKMAVADAAGVGRLATEDIGPFDLSPYKYLKAWVRSSVIIDTNDISILLDDTPECESPLKDLNIGALAANTWTEVVLDMGDTSGCVAIISIGIDMDVDKGIFDFWVDQVRVTKGP